MKPIKLDFSERINELEIIPLGDLHLGDTHSDFKKIKETLDYIQSTETAYTILNGDLMDSAIASSIGDTYGENLSPMEQLEQCVKLFSPIKDKILAVLPGNHEHRHYKSNGIDVTELMCQQLGISDRYSNTTALLFIRFGKERTSGHCRKLLYSIYCTHGSGGGRREGGKVNRLADLASIVDADVYVHSHTHLPLIMKEAFYRVSLSNSTVSLTDKLFINTNAFLTYGGYGDAQAFKPASTDIPHIYLSGKEKKMWARL